MSSGWITKGLLKIEQMVNFPLENRIMRHPKSDIKTIWKEASALDTLSLSVVRPSYKLRDTVYQAISSFKNDNTEEQRWKNYVNCDSTTTLDQTFICIHCEQIFMSWSTISVPALNADGSLPWTSFVKWNQYERRQIKYNGSIIRYIGEKI